jgi:hypothetical protein
MKYTYGVDEKNTAHIEQTGTIGSSTFRNTLSQSNSPIDGAPWTKEEAQQWAETAIQAMKDNNDIFSTQKHSWGM